MHAPAISSCPMRAQDRLQNFFNNHKPKAFRRMRRYAYEVCTLHIEPCQHLCAQDRLQNFFNNHKPKAFRRMRSARSADANHAGSSDSGGGAGAAAAAGVDANPNPNPPLNLNDLGAQLNGALASAAAEAAGTGA